MGNRSLFLVARCSLPGGSGLLVSSCLFNIRVDKLFKFIYFSSGQI